MDIADGQVVAPPRQPRVARALPAILLLFGIGAATLYGVLTAPLLYPYIADSPYYIEAARSLLAGEPLRISTKFGAETETAIFRLWPPGFPVLIAAAASSGLDAADAALWLTKLSVGLLPATVYWAIRRAIGAPLAVAIALLSFSSLGMFDYTHWVSSDAPFALVVALSLGMLLRGLNTAETSRSKRLLFITGLLTALALTIRNSGIALILTELATITALWMSRDGSWNDMLQRVRSLMIGFGIGLVPLLIWYLAAFGVLTPYAMPPSTLGVTQNVTDLMLALASDMFVNLQLGGRSVPFLTALFLLSGTAMVVIAIVQQRPKNSRTSPFATVDRGEDQLRTAFVLFAAAYSLISAAMLVAARTRYNWGETIGERHVAQFDWLFAAAAVTVATQWLARWRIFVAVLIVAMFALFAWRCWFFLDYWHRASVARDEGRIQPRTILQEFAESPAAAGLIAGVPNHCAILSNEAGAINVSFKRRAHEVALETLPMGMASFATLAKPSVLIFVSSSRELDTLTLPSPGPGYHRIHDRLFVAFVPDACQPSR